MQILQIGEKNSKSKFNVKAKAGTRREAAIAQISVKEKPVLHWNKGRVSSGWDHAQLSFQLVKESLRWFLILESVWKQVWVLMV